MACQLQMIVTPPTLFLFLFAGWPQYCGLYTNVYISEDLCRTPEIGSPNPRGSVEHRLRTTDVERDEM